MVFTSENEAWVGLRERFVRGWGERGGRREGGKRGGGREGGEERGEMEGKKGRKDLY